MKCLSSKEISKMSDTLNGALHGSCLCGQIRYEITQQIEEILHCHCSMCRKAHGAAFRTRATIQISDFIWRSGEQLLSRYRSSPGQDRTFCSVCGSSLVTEFDDAPDRLGLALGTLDSDPGGRPACHAFVASKAPWFDITDLLPQWPDYPKRGDTDD
jgi:hypothetical protein